MFDSNSGRFATYGIIGILPGELIDTIWQIIDDDLQGVLDLPNLLTFSLVNNQNRVTITLMSNPDEPLMSFDFDFPYNANYPDQIYAYDDGETQTILLPSEATFN